jgi:hypothetical protein
VAERDHVRADLAGDPVERTAAVAAADVAAVPDAVADERERRRLVAHDPLHADRRDVARQRVDRRGELPLLDRDGHDLVRERRARPGRDERVEQAETVLAARDPDGHAIAGAQHREAPHGSADPVEDRRTYGRHAQVGMHRVATIPYSLTP